jgi:hypothetical protein
MALLQCSSQAARPNRNDLFTEKFEVDSYRNQKEEL